MSERITTSGLRPGDVFATRKGAKYTVLEHEVKTEGIYHRLPRKRFRMRVRDHASGLEYDTYAMDTDEFEIIRAPARAPAPARADEG